MDGGFKAIALGQVSILLFALVLAFAPHLYVAVIIAYLVLMGALMTISQRRFARTAKVEDILDGRKLFEERNAVDIAVSDEELARELSQQMRMMLYSFIGFGIAIAIFASASAFHGQIVEFFKGLLGVESLANFAYWLLVFETVFVATRLTTIMLGGRKTIQPPMVPSRFIVTDKGIVVPSLLGLALRFPLPEDYRVEVNERRRFVEISDPRGRRVRLYTRNPRRLYELIVSLNRRAKEASRT